MKKIILSLGLLVAGGSFIITSTQSCTAIATSSIGVAIIKKILLGGIYSAGKIFNNKEAFLQNDLIIKALPDSLQSLYNGLNKISPQTAKKTKEYIADIAADTVNLSTPILRNAVHQLNSHDVDRIINGGNGMATKVLREKSERELFNTLLPKVEAEMNQYGIAQTVNTLMQGLNGLGNLLGKQNNTQKFQLSHLATEQLVNGIYFLIEKYENEERKDLLNKK